MLRVVVDTNVLVSALLVEGSVPAQVVELMLGGRCEWLVDSRIIAEYRSVLARPEFGFSTARVVEVLEIAEHRTTWVLASPLHLDIADRTNLPFLETAVAGGADAIVTGNVKDFRVKGGRLDLAILSPRAFLELLAGR